MATFTFRFLPREVVVTSIFSSKDGRRARSIRARNGRTVLLNLCPNRRRISPVTRSIEITSSPRAAHSVATVSAAGYRASRSAILNPYSDSLSATHFASTDSAPTLRSGARAGRSSWSTEAVYPLFAGAAHPRCNVRFGRVPPAFEWKLPRGARQALLLYLREQCEPP